MPDYAIFINLFFYVCDLSNSFFLRGMICPILIHYGCQNIVKLVFGSEPRDDERG
jgi:hypothetical protein